MLCRRVFGPLLRHFGAQRAPVLASGGDPPSLTAIPEQGLAVGINLPSPSAGTRPFTFTTRFMLDGVQVGADNDATYTPFLGDVGKTLVPRVIVTNGAGPVTYDGAGSVVQSGASVPSGATSAPTLTGNPPLRASWNFDDTASLTLSGSDIAVAAGVDGTSYALTGTGAERPKLVSFGGRGAARFLGAQALRIASDLGLGSGPVTFVVIAEAAAKSAENVFLHFGGANYSYSKQHVVRTRAAVINSPDGYSYTRVSVYGQGAGANESSPYQLGRHMLVGVGRPLSDGTIALYVDGVARKFVTSTTSDNVPETNFNVGAAGAISDYLSMPLAGWVYRVLVYGAALTDANVSELEAWAQTAWVIGGAASSQRGANVSWVPPQDAGAVDGYRVAWSQTYLGTDTTADVAVGTLSYEVTGLTPGMWYFSVASLSGGVASPYMPILQKQVE